MRSELGARVQGAGCAQHARRRWRDAAHHLRHARVGGPTVSRAYNALAPDGRILQPVIDILDEDVYVFHTKCNSKEAMTRRSTVAPGLRQLEDNETRPSRGW